MFRDDTQLVRARWSLVVIADAGDFMVQYRNSNCAQQLSVALNTCAKFAPSAVPAVGSSQFLGLSQERDVVQVTAVPTAHLRLYHRVDQRSSSTSYLLFGWLRLPRTSHQMSRASAVSALIGLAMGGFFVTTSFCPFGGRCSRTLFGCLEWCSAANSWGLP